MKKMMFNDRYGLTEAIIEKRKTVTRRVVNKFPNESTNEKYLKHCLSLKKPPYKVGEIVAVAQSYKDCGEFDVYEAPKDTAGWKNKMFVKAELMPHQIRILDVRAERLQNITDEDCLREGIESAEVYEKEWSEKTRTMYRNPVYKRMLDNTSREAFATLIAKISGRGTWERNPYVWRIEFELIK